MAGLNIVPCKSYSIFGWAARHFESDSGNLVGMFYTTQYPPYSAITNVFGELSLFGGGMLHVVTAG